ncbi:hypothetical protein EH228_04540 [Erwinia endophytica]|nr:hypothetical protein EH228_04540 [Erwinia endophytica]
MNEQICAGCGTPLSTDGTYVCDSCTSFYEMTDPNTDMRGEGDE